MAGHSASCPGCGAEVVFRFAHSRVLVCGHCNSLVARTGADLANHGKVADLIPTQSVLKLGIEGREVGERNLPGRHFTLVGRLQLDHGAGAWDEWHVAFGDNSLAWLSEAQGALHLMGPVTLPPVPRWSALSVGDVVDLGPPGSFLVTEVKQATFKSGSGELPFDVRPGSPFYYADLAGPGGRLATLDYGGGDDAQAAYVGGEVTFESLGIKSSDLLSDEERRGAATATALSCPQCAGPLELRASDQTKRIACPWCGSLLDATSPRFTVLDVQTQPPMKPLIPLGAKGRLEGIERTAIGVMQRSTMVEGVPYSWREYLLYHKTKGFRWLAEANGHWTFIRQLPAGEFRKWAGVSQKHAAPKSVIYHAGLRYKHFQSSHATVDHVLGEFYWAVARGDVAEMEDYVCPPYMLSIERSADELQFSRGTYVTPLLIWQAFSLSGEPRAAKGVGPCQPWSGAEEARRVQRFGFAMLAVLLALYIGFSVRSAAATYRQRVHIAADAIPGSPEAVLFTEPFEVRRRGLVAVEVSGSLSNRWCYLDGALINEATGTVDEFDVEVSHYSGRDADGSWTEDRRTRTRYLPGIAPGTYVLRLAPQWDRALPVDGYRLTVKSGVPRLLYTILAGLAIAAWPIVAAVRGHSHEVARWSESDHPMGGS